MNSYLQPSNFRPPEIPNPFPWLSKQWFEIELLKKQEKVRLYQQEAQSYRRERKHQQRVRDVKNAMDAQSEMLAQVVLRADGSPALAQEFMNTYQIGMALIYSDMTED